MSLIEQLGGYEKVKNHRDYLASYGSEFAGVSQKEINELNTALLEYRRQHNIFEVGDWVVNIKTGAFGDFIKYTDTNKGHKHCFVDIGLCDVALFCVKNIRHATDAEIKAGEDYELA